MQGWVAGEGGDIEEEEVAGPPPAAAAREMWCRVAEEGLLVVELDNMGSDNRGLFRPLETLRGLISASDFFPPIVLSFCSVLLYYCV